MTICAFSPTQRRNAGLALPDPQRLTRSHTTDTHALRSHSSATNTHGVRSHSSATKPTPLHLASQHHKRSPPQTFMQRLLRPRQKSTANTHAAMPHKEHGSSNCSSIPSPQLHIYVHQPTPVPELPSSFPLSHAAGWSDATFTPKPNTAAIPTPTLKEPYRTKHSYLHETALLGCPLLLRKAGPPCVISSVFWSFQSSYMNSQAMFDSFIRVEPMKVEGDASEWWRTLSRTIKNDCQTSNKPFVLQLFSRLWLRWNLFFFHEGHNNLTLRRWAFNSPNCSICCCHMVLRVVRVKNAIN